ncbi:MAG TPA: PLP-dependent aminotransferase family protein [Bacillus bacterium]|uniref:GntR family transcriptional regulator n=1 Tax=Siminovitchia fordii TaxID=254759 RepID=A0ABQ4K4J8_9BACI|nr:PLP-dependent aminotransferase family protein [Siminovitchia fordii]GIN20654.1 GntR family transcriptional regulator [Siminovitchia fordii]HBZ08663.1 PLP-dependent aminotransferase family protein [Bacillus sp. (in: firmicutes)]
MEICPQLENQSSEPLYLQLYQYFKDNIQTGGISSYKRLPSIRELANDLHVSRTTVQMAYQQLLAEGYIESKERSGYFVVDIDRDPFGDLPQIPQTNPENKLPVQKKNLFNFYMSGIDVDHFPFQKWKTCINHSLSTEFLSYGDRQGEPGLRLEISHYLRQARAVNCTKEQIVIGAGTQTIMRLLCELIVFNEKKIAMEEPGYEGVRHVFHRHGFEVVPIKLEKDGIDLDELAKSGAKVVYITPSHQYPLGMVMPISKRMKLLQWAEENNGWIIEDDYDGEFRYHGKPIPSLQGLDAHGHVVYTGTFSKSLMPAIRMSYTVLPKRLLDIYQENMSMYDQTVSRLHQKSLQAFMESGEWERHIRRMRKIYQRKHDLLLQTIKNVMNAHVEITGQNAGLHIAIQVNSKKNADELVQIAEQSGIKVYSTTANWISGQEKGKPLILLGFGGLSEKQIVDGIALLHQAWLPFYKKPIDPHAT